MKMTLGTGNGEAGPTDSQILTAYAYDSIPKNIIEPQ